MKIDFISARNNLRVASAVAAVVMMSGAGAAWADVDVSGENGTTGSSSTNLNTYTVDDTVNLDVDNTSAVSNTPSVTVDTGNNDVLDNTTVEDIMGGDIDVSGEFTNDLNSGDMDLSMDTLGDVSGDFSNDTTGSSSNNRNTMNVDRNLNVDVDNVASISNDIDANLNSGNNTVRDNTTVGDVETGGVDFSVTVDNTANHSGSTLSMPDLGNTSVDADFSNDTTGANSDNRNTINVDDNIDVLVNNVANVSNDLDVTGDSGNNDVRRNTTVGDIRTGSQSYDFTFTNVLN